MNKIPVLFIFYLISCGASKNDLSTQHDRPDRFLMLLSKFDDKKFDTLQVYSPQDLEGEYKGVPLDSADAILFPLEIAKQHFAEPPGIFAIYKFPIDKNRTALIARTPSVYVQSSIKLFLLDRTKDTITSMIELAESWGDAGDYMEKKALLFKNQKQQLNALIWLLIGHDSSVDNLADTTIQECNSYFLLNLSGNKADTVSKNYKDLSTKFEHLLR
jgi:hypothetical protein